MCTSRSGHRRAAQAAIPRAFPYALMCGHVIAKSGYDVRLDEVAHVTLYILTIIEKYRSSCLQMGIWHFSLPFWEFTREILSPPSLSVPSFSSFPSFWSVTRSVCSATLENLDIVLSHVISSTLMNTDSWAHGRASIIITMHPSLVGFAVFGVS